jgi:HEAT repeat protein
MNMASTGAGDGDPGWVEEFRDAMQHRDIDAALAVLSTRNTAHAGTPNTADKRTAVGVLTQVVTEPSEKFQLGARLAQESQPVASQLAAKLITQSYEWNRPEAVELIHKIADHPNWEVREGAAGSLGFLLTSYWADFYPICRAWTMDPSPNVRRAVVLAAKETGSQRELSRAEPLLDLLESLMPDRDRYVRENLGPFAIGDGLLRYYPEVTMNRIWKWQKFPDEASRWNVAMALSAAEAAKHVEEALKLLASLAEDPRPFVWRAAATALRSLGRRRPQEVLPHLEAWLDGPRKPAAERALSYLKKSA